MIAATAPFGMLHAGIVVLVLIAVLVAGAIFGQRSPPRLPYTLRPHFLTKTEREFLAALETACGPGYRIFSQVRLADILASGIPTDAFGAVAAKSLDFVICRADSLAFVAAVELDDRSHRQARRRERDAFVDALCDHIGLPLLRIPAAARYDPERITPLLPFGRPN